MRLFKYKVYVIRLPWGKVKLGLSKNLYLRFQDHATERNAKHVCIWFPTRNKKSAYRFEQYLLGIFFWLRWWGKKEEVWMPVYTWVILLPIPVLLWYMFLESTIFSSLLIILILCLAI